MTRRILNRIRLDKIAAVDKPCQEHATVALIKRAPTTEPSLFKRTFDEVLDGALVAQRVSEAFYRAFDKLWTYNDAFKTALTDELADGGTGEAASAAYIDSVRALVDGAVTAARTEGAKATDEELEKAFNTAATDWLAKISPEEKTMKIETKAALTAAITKFDPATALVADVAAIKKAAKDLGAEDLLPADGPLALEKADPAVAQMQRELAILKMAPAVKKHFDGLDEAGQTAFLAKSEAEQAAEVDAIEKGDPILYTTRDGTPIRKSDGSTALALAKSNDELAKQVANLSTSGSADRIEKRAAEFPNVAKAVAVDMLKSVETLGADTEAGKAVLKSLDLMNKGQKAAFTVVGANDGPSPSLAKAKADWDGAVQTIKKRDDSTLAAAMEKARVEHPDLFAEAFPTSAAAAEDEEADAA